MAENSSFEVALALRLPEVVLIVKEKDLKFHAEEVGSQSCGKVEKGINFDEVPGLRKTCSHHHR